MAMTAHLLAWVLLALGFTKAAGSIDSNATMQVDLSGYVPVGDGRMFYTYYEAQDRDGKDDGKDVPVILWLQGGPGCASQFGSLYELGPQRVAETKGGSLVLEPNEGAWNRRYGLLFIDQPLGTGFSIPGPKGIPDDEMEVAADLYTALQHIFKRHSQLRGRPLVLAGESYAGKYVPSTAHFILQQEEEAHVEEGEQQQEGKGGVEGKALEGGLQEAAGGPPETAAQAATVGARGNSSSCGNGTAGARLQHHRELPPRAVALGRPAFRLAGAIIGNGLTDPAAQVMLHGDVCHAMGLLDQRQRAEALRRGLLIVMLISHGRWAAAHAERGALLSSLEADTGAATLLDVRRDAEYDAGGLVERYLNQEDVKAALGVPADVRFESCSARVGEALGADIMRSVAYLVPDVLRRIPLLLYQGQYDVQDGPASVEEWVNALDWPGREGFASAARLVWRVKPTGGPVLLMQGDPAVRPLVGEQQEQQGHSGGGREGRSGGEQKGGSPVAGYWKQSGMLSLVVLRDAGHMVPRDVPIAARLMVERWAAEQVQGGAAPGSGAVVSAAAAA